MTERWRRVSGEGLPNPCQSDTVEDRGPRHGTDEAERDDDDGERHDPEDVFGKEDLSVAVADIVGLADDGPS